MNLVLTNCSKENLVYPLTVWDIAETQSTDMTVKRLLKNDRYCVQILKSTRVLCKHGKLVTPKDLRYCHYL